MSVTIYLGLLVVCGLVSDSVQIIIKGPPCVLRGIEYTMFDKLPRPCSRCRCTDKGEVQCSEGVCSLVQCFIRGRRYHHKDRTDDPCNRCLCYNGEELCSKRWCDIDSVPTPRTPKGCVVEGKYYEHGQESDYPLCICYDGGIMCA